MEIDSVPDKCVFAVAVPSRQSSLYRCMLLLLYPVASIHSEKIHPPLPFPSIPLPPRQKMTREEQTIAGGSGANGPPPEKCCISWTGGKDCNLALLECWRDPSLNVTDLVVFRPESRADFEAHPMELMKAQADSLGLALRVMVLSASQSYRDAYVDAIRRLRDDLGIRVIATGDMDLVEIENSSDNYIKECCEMLPGGGIRAYLPLWKAEREDCLRTLLVDNGCKVVFSCVKSPWFDASWCGRTLDETAVREMEAIRRGEVDRVSFTEAERSGWGTKDPRRIPLDLGGENGEYHSMVLDGPLYRYGIELRAAPGGDAGGIDSRPTASVPLRSVVSGPAKNGEDRWWTYTGQTRWSLVGFEVGGVPENGSPEARER
ncbi:unnamed protein product [Pseudo-nitzschia multistriata]|uniref:Diphthine--ammonia ligase n=1 Tax=Pseudo-nitzschia multistriata TaxID=183589 RepID=A0A448ZJR4_9STRA|nr:unnamed protein product [Pseudo-nitzschia multistriata]